MRLEVYTNVLVTCWIIFPIQVAKVYAKLAVEPGNAIHMVDILQDIRVTVVAMPKKFVIESQFLTDGLQKPLNEVVKVKFKLQ